jgi:hypothetical protein
MKAKLIDSGSFRTLTNSPERHLKIGRKNSFKTNMSLLISHSIESSPSKLPLAVQKRLERRELPDITESFELANHSCESIDIE